MDPIDRSLCSFPVPEFSSQAEEATWTASLTPAQRIELLELGRLARHGAAALAEGLDRSHFELLSRDEFVRRKHAEDEAEEVWRIEHGWPPRVPGFREAILRRREEER